MKKTNNQYKKAKGKVLNILSDDKKLPSIVARVFNIPHNIPCRGYSLLNKIIIGGHHTFDVRGYRAWQKVGRNVKKGSKAIYIFAPIIKKIKNENKEDKEERIIKGFRMVPVFRVEDTEGEPLDYDIPKTPSLPFIDVAKHLNIDISAKFFLGKTLGSCYYKSRKIHLMSPAELIWLHEFTHQIHADIVGNEKMEKMSSSYIELVANFGSLVLATLMGYEITKMEYTKLFINDIKKYKFSEIQKCLSDTEKITNYILEINEMLERRNNGKNN